MHKHLPLRATAAPLLATAAPLLATAAPLLATAALLLVTTVVLGCSSEAPAVLPAPEPPAVLPANEPPAVLPAPAASDVPAPAASDVPALHLATIAGRRVQVSGVWPLRGAVAYLTPGGRLELWNAGNGVRPIHDEVLPQASTSPDGKRLVYARRPPAGGALWLLEAGSGRRRRLTPGGAASMPVVSPDGARVAYLDTGPDGIAALFVVSLVDGRPRQLTNVGLRRDGHGPPVGFVPLPTGQLRWDGDADRLRFRAAGRAWTVEVQR